MKAALSPLTFWYHDLCSCLQATLATLLIRQGHDPVLTLGASWDFYYVPGDVRKEEFYYPPRASHLAGSLAPYHPIVSRWHHPVDAAAGWLEVREHVLQGNPAIVAVDNFHLPFRPAYQDVHAAHLVLVEGFDEEANQVHLLDSMPPAFHGTIRLDELRAARGSYNPNDGSDDFFASSPINNRWLEVEFTGPFPELTRTWVKEVISNNLNRFRQSIQDSAHSGMAGLTRYLTELSQRAASTAGGTALEELYVLGWPLQAGTGLHADFLMTAGQRLQWYEAIELGRMVDRLAHHWTGLRMTAAHGRKEPTSVSDRLAQRAVQLLADQEIVLSRMEWLIARS